MFAKPRFRLRPRHSHSDHAVHLEWSNPAARRVSVAGTFNNWAPEKGQMHRVDNGTWVVDLLLKPGTYEYRLVVDGKWIADPNSDHNVLNPFGERNSLLTVA